MAGTASSTPIVIRSIAAASPETSKSRSAITGRCGPQGIINVPSETDALRLSGVYATPFANLIVVCAPRTEILPATSRTGGSSPITSNRVSETLKSALISSPVNGGGRPGPLKRPPAREISMRLSFNVPPKRFFRTHSRAPSATSIGQRCFASATAIFGMRSMKIISGEPLPKPMLPWPYSSPVLVWTSRLENWSRC